MGNVIGNPSLEEIKEFMEKEEVSILYFGGENCSVCHAVFPRLIETLKDDSIPILKIDSERSRDISGQFVVFTIPTILIFSKGKEILRESRFIDFDRMKRTLKLIKSRKEY